MLSLCAYWILSMSKKKQANEPAHQLALSLALSHFLTNLDCMNAPGTQTMLTHEEGFASSNSNSNLELSSRRPMGSGLQRELNWQSDVAQPTRPFSTSTGLLSMGVLYPCSGLPAEPRPQSTLATHFVKVIFNFFFLLHPLHSI